jgi:hypothetical protein
MPGPVPYRIRRREDADSLCAMLNNRHPDRLHRPVRPSRRAQCCWRIEIVKRETGEHIGLVLI